MTFTIKGLDLPVWLRVPEPIDDGQLLQFCAANRDLRIEREANGEILVMAPVGSDTGSTELEIGAQLVNWARIDGRGKAFGPSTGFRLSDTAIKSPDAAWMSLLRWKSLSREEQTGYAPLCPEFIIEIRSKGDRLTSLKAKMEMWMSNGTEVAWLIDREREKVTIYRSGEKPEVLVSPSSVTGTGPVAGFTLVMD